MNDLEPRRETFRELHRGGCFVIPNPWDRGSAVFLERLGFKALATSSAGFAFTRGLPDSALALDRDLVLAHIADVVASTTLPVNADFQAGYGTTPREVAESVRRCVDAGVAGLSIEDASGDPARPLFDLDSALERLSAARRAIDESKSGVMLTARAECFLTRHPNPLEESVRRLRAYAAAGADVLFAPGVRNLDGIRSIVDAVAPKPVNLLIGWGTTLKIPDIASTGVRRISVGSALARVAWTSFAVAARALREKGDFSAFEGLASTAEVGSWFDPGSTGN